MTTVQYHYMLLTAVEVRVQWGWGWGWGSVPWLVCVRFPSQVLKCPSQAVYTCTQPNIQDPFDEEQCTVSGGLRTCAIKEGARPALLSSSDTLGVYICMG